MLQALTVQLDPYNMCSKTHSRQNVVQFCPKNNFKKLNSYVYSKLNYKLHLTSMHTLK